MGYPFFSRRGAFASIAALAVLIATPLSSFAAETTASSRAATSTPDSQKRQSLLNYWNAIRPVQDSQYFTTLGIELEGVIPGATRELAFQALEKIFLNELAQQLYPGVPVRLEHYDFETRRGDPRHGTRVIFEPANAKPIVWQIKDDGSIQPPPGYFGVEIVSPILYTPQDVQNFRRIEERFTEAGFQAEPGSAALQTHGGFTSNGPLSQESITDSSQVAETFVLTWVYAKIEEQLMDLYKTNPKRQKFTMPTPESFLTAIEQGLAVDNVNLYQLVSTHYNYRYWALNLYALFQFGTVEVRFPNSSTDLVEFDGLVDFTTRLIRAVRTKDPRLFKIMNEHIRGPIPLEKFAQTFDMKIQQLIERERRPTPVVSTPAFYEDDRVLRLAVSLGRASESLSAAQAHAVFESLTAERPVPTELTETWQRLLKLAQACIMIADNKIFFAQSFSIPGAADKSPLLVQGSFGLNARDFKDEAGRAWSFTSDVVASPEFTNPSEMEQMAALVWRLSAESPSTQGVVQSFRALPPGESADEKTMALAIQNVHELMTHFQSAFAVLLGRGYEFTPFYNVVHPEQSELRLRLSGTRAPEDVLRATYIAQLVLNKAWSLAKQHLSWSSGPLTGAAPERLLSELGVKDENILKFALGQSFSIVDPKPHAHDFYTTAFEMESLSENLVNLILPRDPLLRARWRSMPSNERLQVLASKGYVFDQNFTYEKYFILTSEFYADVQKFAFLSPELHHEGSGNWEIKSSLQGLKSTEELAQAVESLEEVVPKDDFRLHMHNFFPNRMIRNMTADEADRFTDFLERLSFYMLLSGYDEAPTDKPHHFYDSWGLDRYSIRDLQSVLRHIQGHEALDFKAQKYHNVGYRPVEGGLDLELRDIANDVRYAATLSSRIRSVFVERNFGSIPFTADPPLFMGHGENPAADERRFTLEEAVAARRPLTPAQRELLRKLQFEIYKPFMRDQLFFFGKEITTYEETEPKDLDTKWVRTNYENNVVIPLLNYEQQSFLTTAQKKKLAQHREAFVAEVSAVLDRIETAPAYAFMRRTKDFLHLADWLKISTHPSKPDFSLVTSEREAKRQRVLLENLVYKLRGLSARFTQDTGLVKIVGESIGVRYESTEPTVTKPMSTATSRPVDSCKDAFKP